MKTQRARMTSRRAADGPLADAIIFLSRHANGAFNDQWTRRTVLYRTVLCAPPDVFCSDLWEPKMLTRNTLAVLRVDMWSFAGSTVAELERVPEYLGEIDESIDFSEVFRPPLPRTCDVLSLRRSLSWLLLFGRLLVLHQSSVVSRD